tara:strand:- start:11609 stop:12439 length:831 start_codon:yes stop_codon:yes gene_type:complete
MRQIKFDSIRELGAHVDKLQAANAPRENRTSTANRDPEWYGHCDMSEAIEFAHNGGNWEKGADLMPRIHVAHETLSGAPIMTPQVYSDMVGFAPCVPAFLSGAPDSMLAMEDAPEGDKLIRVAVHVGRSSGIEQKEIMNRGAAIIAVLDQLSLEGYSVELYAIWRNTDDSGSVVSVETCIKHGCDQWSPVSVAYALCHAAFQRRLCWRVAESINEAEEATGLDDANKVMNSGYGNGISVKFEDYNLSFGYVTDGSTFGSIERAAKEIKRLTIEQLK